MEPKHASFWRDQKRGSTVRFRFKAGYRASKATHTHTHPSLSHENSLPSEHRIQTLAMVLKRPAFGLVMLGIHSSAPTPKTTINCKIKKRCRRPKARVGACQRVQLATPILREWVGVVGMNWNRTFGSQRKPPAPSNHPGSLRITKYLP